MLGAIQDMKYYLRTAYGDSRNCRGAKFELKFQGLCCSWTVISITMLNAHKRKGHGAVFQCPITKEPLDLAAILYVDDCDLLHVAMTRNDSAQQVTFHKMQEESVMNWGQLLIGSGGAYKPVKCFYHLISFQWNCKEGEWPYAENHEIEEYEMRVPLLDGMTEVIEHLPEEDFGGVDGAHRYRARRHEQGYAGQSKRVD